LEEPRPYGKLGVRESATAVDTHQRASTCILIRNSERKGTRGKPGSVDEDTIKINFALIFYEDINLIALPSQPCPPANFDLLVQNTRIIFIIYIQIKTCEWIKPLLEN
jgi:hypothetical protein